MALVRCKECGHNVSTNAKYCVNCGAKPPMATHSKIIWGAFCVIIFAGFFAAGISKPPSAVSDAPALALTSLECIPGKAMAIVTGSV